MARERTFPELMTLEDISRIIGPSGLRYQFEEAKEKVILAQVANHEGTRHMESLNFIPGPGSDNTGLPPDYFTIEIHSTLFNDTIMSVGFTRVAETSALREPLYKVSSTSQLVAAGSSVFCPVPVIDHPFIQNFAKFAARQHKGKSPRLAPEIKPH